MPTYLTPAWNSRSVLTGIAWGTVPGWIEALAMCALAIEVYVRWKRDPRRPLLDRDEES